jgi:transposase
VGRKGVEQLLAVVTDARDTRVPELARACVVALGAQLRMLMAQILEFDRRILAWHRSNEICQRLDELPGVGPALATALVASVADPKPIGFAVDCGIDGVVGLDILAERKTYGAERTARVAFRILL